MVLRGKLFFRQASPFDVTQVGAVIAAITVQELKNFFSSRFHEYRGLDGAPVEVRLQRANGLNWTLPTSTSNGRPVDLAIAPDGCASLIIILFSHPEEHDSLYRTVFLLMVDSAR